MADEGLIRLLEEASPSLPKDRPAQELVARPAAPPDLTERLESLRWEDDTVGGKWDKIRSAFLNAKTPEDLFLDGSAMSTREWLEYAIKMAPRQAEPQAVQITAIRIELPSRSGLDGDVIEVEVPAQS